MSHRYTDYLFALYMNSGPVSLDTLLGQIGADDNPEKVLQSMEELGLIERSRVDGAQYIDLTERGRGVSIAAADLITSRMMSEWQDRISREYASPISA